MNERDHHRQNCLHINWFACSKKKEKDLTISSSPMNPISIHWLHIYTGVGIYDSHLFTGKNFLRVISVFLRVIRFCTGFLLVTIFFRWQEEQCGKYRRSRWSWLSLSLFTLSSHFPFVIVFVLVYFYTFEYCTQVTGSGVPRCLAFPTLLHTLTHLSYTHSWLSHTCDLLSLHTADVRSASAVRWFGL